jgi:RNA polymerase sigma-70 factor (ECF subfamily)
MTCSEGRTGTGARKAVGAGRRTHEPRAGAERSDQGSAADARLVELAAGGDAGAFEELFGRYRERVYRIAYGWCFDAQLALDLVQDVFIRAFRSLGRFRSEASVWTWLCRIAINRCLDYVRKKERTKEISVEAPEDVAAHPQQNHADPADAAQLQELKHALARAIGNLSPEARAAFTLRFFENLSYKEIAAALDCSVGTVMSRLFYARQKLRTLLEGYM